MCTGWLCVPAGYYASKRPPNAAFEIVEVFGGSSLGRLSAPKSFDLVRLIPQG